MAVTRYLAFVLFLVVATYVAATCDARMKGDKSAGAVIEQLWWTSVAKVRSLADIVKRDMP